MEGGSFIHQGDFKEILELTPNDSVDLILIDPPYGTMKNTGLYGNNSAKMDWDISVDGKQIIDMADKILKVKRKLISFSSQPYTTELIKSSTKYINHNYNLIWNKCSFAVPLGVNKNPVFYHEDIVVFNKTHTTEITQKRLRNYFSLVKNHINKPISELVIQYGSTIAHSFSTESRQFYIPTKHNYNKLIRDYGIDEMGWFLDYEKLIRIKEDNNNNNNVFNVWRKDDNHLGSIFRYPKDKGRYHPTQKPVALLSDLIKTFTNPGDLVVDFFMGSGSTGVACKETGRRFIGIEKEAKYCETARERMAWAGLQTKLF